ncbi:hypothetical protein [uncultured Thiodictyon sp.]|uniref:hypothetical protein n=1 Tax=uncultured Thiodictyon sp. TaxID=1846217 RepID=UPI0025DE24AD|nr:hypothetical protein [uncultured Thiodictyon sp.]
MTTTNTSPLTTDASDAEHDAGLAALAGLLADKPIELRIAVRDYLAAAFLSGVLSRTPRAEQCDDECIPAMVEFGLVEIARPTRGRTGAPYGGRRLRRVRVTLKGWRAMDAVDRMLQERDAIAA